MLSGQVYDHATAEFIKSIVSNETRMEVVSIYVQALKLVWLVGLTFAAASLLVVAAEKPVALRVEVFQHPPPSSLEVEGERPVHDGRRVEETGIEGSTPSQSRML